MQTIHLFDTPAISTHDAIIIENYWKLFGYDSKQYIQECKALGLPIHRSLYTDAKQADACSTKQLDTWEKSLRAKHNNAVDGTILDIDLQSLQYEDAVNALLFGYTSDVGYTRPTTKRSRKNDLCLLLQTHTRDWQKFIAPNAHLASLDKPLSTYYLTRDIAKINIQKNKKPKTKQYANNPFIWAFTKRLQVSPLDIVENIYLAHDANIQAGFASLAKCKAHYAKHHGGKQYNAIKNAQNTLQKYL